MKLLKNLMIFTVMLALSLNAVAQQDKEAEAILKKVKEKYNAYNNMRVDFTQEIKNPESNLEQKMNGTLFLKGDQFRLEIADQIMISDNINFWIYFQPENEVIIDHIKSHDMFKPSDIFNMYDKDFIYKLNGTTRIGGKNHHIIQFTPKNAKSRDAFFHTIMLYVAADDFTIRQAQIMDKNNTVMTYNINRVQPNQTLPKDTFTFDRAKYPKVVVTDKRRN